MTGNKNLDKIIMMINLVLMLGAVGVFVFTNIISQRPLVDEAAQERDLEASARSATNPHLLKLEKLTINLRSASKRLRYLDIEIFLETFKKEHMEDIESKRSEILDLIIDITGRMKPEELNSLAGKILLEDRLKKAINAHFRKPHVKKVFFAHFVIQ